MNPMTSGFPFITQSAVPTHGSRHDEITGLVKERTSMERKGAIVVAFAALLVCALAVPARAQFNSGSSGIHGVFPPVPVGGPVTEGFFMVWNIQTGTVRYCSGYTIGTGLDVCDAGSAINRTAQINNPPTNGVYEFQSFTLPVHTGNNGRYLVIVGASPNTPLSILSQGDITFSAPTACCDATAIFINGLPGKNPAGGSSAGFSMAGGKGGPGGFDGGASGNGGATPSNGNAGFGTSGGAGGATNAATVAGLHGVGAAAGPLNPSLSPLSGGAGGGGAAGIASGALTCGVNTVGWGGGSAGGGGGALLLAATGKVTLAGASAIYAYGGAGGSNPGSGCGLYGGGGAGGSVRIVATEFTGTGTIWVGGGARPDGPRASGGFVRIEASINTYAGTIDSAAGGSFLSFPTAPIPANLPTLRITSVAGTAAPQNPKAGLLSPDITFANAISTPITVQVAASNVPLTTPVNIKVVPAVGSPVSTTTGGLSGTVASSSASALVTLPPGAGVVTASATFNVSGQQALLNSLPLIDGERPTQVEVVAEADGRSRTYLIAKSGARFEVGR
jgi:hypothetical protein